MDPKTTAIAILWTVIAVLIGIFVNFNRKQTLSPASTPVVRSALASQPTPATVLVSLNDLLIRTDSLELIEANVRAFRNLAANASRVYLLFTIPAQLVPENNTDGQVPEFVRSCVEACLETAGLFVAGIQPHRIVFTQTSVGRTSVAREMQPDLFLDSEAEVVRDLVGKVPSVSHLTSETFGAKIAQIFPS